MGTYIGLTQTLLLISLLASVGTAAVSPRFVFVEEWQYWKSSNGKLYESQREELERHLVWVANKEYIEQHNINAQAGIFSYTLALNQFADMTDAEHAERYLTYNKTKHHHGKDMDVKIYVPPSFSYWPKQIDWRQKRAVSAVKNQENCGASYAFASIGALESSYSLAYGDDTVLSEQNIIDCSLPEGNNGCTGGNMYNSFMYMVFNDGVSKASQYPYQGVQMPCNFSYEGVGATMSGIVMIRSGSETDLEAALAFTGPVAAAIDGSSSSFRFYSKGVLDSYRCSSYNLNHAVLIIGYGTTSENQEYWRVKNSWGTRWGQGGYILMSRNRYNQCGIASDASYPSL